MKKKVISLTEQELRRIVKESVSRVLVDSYLKKNYRKGLRENVSKIIKGVTV